MNLKALIVISLIFLLSGCLITEWEDVSADSEFKSIIGIELKTKVGFTIHGVTMESNYENILHHYSLMKSPGFSGPEVLSKEKVLIGTSFKLIKVIRCIDCTFKKEKIVLELTSSDKYKDAPIIYSYDLFIKNQNKYFE